MTKQMMRKIVESSSGSASCRATGDEPREPLPSRGLVANHARKGSALAPWYNGRMASFDLSDPKEHQTQDTVGRRQSAPPTDPAGLMLYLGRDMALLPDDLNRVASGSVLTDLLRQLGRGPSGPMPKVLMPAAMGGTGTSKGGAIR